MTAAPELTPEQRVSRLAGRSRRKGVRGEREVAAVYQSHGFEVRGLEGGGDHRITPGLVKLPGGMIHVPRHRFELHSECKRCERLKLPEWWAQTVQDAAPGTVPVLHTRQNHGEWLATLRLDDLARLLAR